MQKLSSNTLSIFESATNEKDIENGYRYYFKTVIPDIVFTSPYGCDGFGVSDTKELRVLCEFKDDLNLHSKNDLVKVLCQLIYYIKKFEQAGQKLPKTVFIGDRNECVVMHVNDLFHYLSMNFDWSIAPSNAHKNLELFQELSKDEKITPFIFEIDALNYAIEKCLDLTQNVKRHIPITPHNITEVYNYFERNVIGQTKLTTNEVANLFIQILISPTENYLHPVKSKKVVVTKNFGEVPVKSKESFDSFFGHFSREYTPREKEALTSIVDRLVEDTTRRKQGEFFTPTIWVDKAHEYITSVFGEDWKEKYVVWDPAWGTGNLTRDYKFKELYVSTLNQSDIDTANQMGYNSEAVKFQFDFLNDPDEKLPLGLRNVIESGREIIVLMNPPYGTVNDFKNIKNDGGSSKKNIEKTLVKKLMNEEGMGLCVKNLYSQFFYRLSKIKKLSFAFFSPPLMYSGSDFKIFRKKILDRYDLKKGFIMNSSNFADVGNWGITFSILKENILSKDSKKEYSFDLIEKIDIHNLVYTGNKIIYNLDDNLSSSVWVRKEVKNKKKYTDLPKLSSALNVKQKGYSKLCESAFGYFFNAGNNVYYNKTNVALFSSAFSNKSGLSVIDENLKKVTIMFSARKLIDTTWLNQKDEYMAPDENHECYQQFTNDSIVFSLFNSSSQQSSLRQITYKDKLWDIKNEFFWMSKEEMLNLANDNNYTELYSDARTSPNRYVYNLLFGEERIYDKLSPDAKLVLDKATELVKKSMPMRQIMADNQNHLNSWDAGYAQLKLVWKEHYTEEFKEFRQLYKNLEDRMRPLVYELGFLMK